MENVLFQAKVRVNGSSKQNEMIRVTIPSDPSGRRDIHLQKDIDPQVVMTIQGAKRLRSILDTAIKVAEIK